MSVRSAWPAVCFLGTLAACTPEPMVRAETPVDPAPIKAAQDSLRAQYARAYMAGDAAGIAALYSEPGAIDFYGAPPMRGQAGIEAGLKAGFAIQQPVFLEIVAARTTPVGDSRVGELGTYHSADRLNGKLVHSWGRWVTSAAKDSAGVWRLNYLMAFPDSQKTDK